MRPSSGSIVAASDAEAALLWREVFSEGCYDRALRVAGTGAIIDGGANIGAFTVRARELCAEARIIAIEPARETLEYLCANLRACGVEAEVLHGALGGEDSMRDFSYYPQAPGQSGFYVNEHRDDHATATFLIHSGMAAAEAWELAVDIHRTIRHEPVPVFTLRSIVDRFGIDRIGLLKLDVEGSEVEVMATIDDDIWGRIEALAMEVHCPKPERRRIADTLRSHGMVSTWSQDPRLAGTDMYFVIATAGRR